MKATIYFLYSGGWDSRDTAMETAEKDIRYWLRKSPGCHELSDILVVPESARRDWMSIPDKMRAEEIEYEAQKKGEFERAEYERLKAKFTPPAA